VIHVLAFITAKPGQRARVLELFAANVPAVLAEDGCLAYEAAVDAEGVGPFQAEIGPDSFVVVERWTSVAALQAHAAAPHMRAYGAATKELVEGRIIHVLSPHGG
jgi:quinol monooxygenase YgiN